MMRCFCFFFFFSSRRRHTRLQGDWSSDVCSSDLFTAAFRAPAGPGQAGGPAKDVTAVLTGGRLKTKPALSGRGHRLDDVREMVFHAPLGDAEAMRKVSGSAGRAGGRLDDLLPDSASL